MRFSRVCLATAALAVMLGLAAVAAAADNPFKMPPPFKSAIINYSYSGNQQGQSTVYFKGDTRAEHKKVVTKILGFGSEDNSIIITEPQRVTTVDLGKNEAYYTGNYITYLAQEYDKLSPAEKKRVKKNAEQMGGNFLAAMGGSKPQVSQGTFLNHPVEIVKVMGLTSYTWKGKGVVLKQEGGIMGMQMNLTATQVRTGVPIPADKLAPPPGIKPVFNQEADNQQRQMAKQVMDMLKDPDFGKKQSQAMQDASRQAKEAQAQQHAAQQQAGKSAPASGQPQDGSQSQSGDMVQEGLNAAKKLLNW
ncbi:hypothetical protein [Desulfoferula mesophila]|uniref:DUF4412 domain-containing protein n=1 Tax=Desulfoferula mesophila TaxID=3058419 RepID=A0AAU9EI76_9BACT|nr:hypothetical protein FAK_38290 [Desulfoferula mesophilus]